MRKQIFAGTWGLFGLLLFLTACASNVRSVSEFKSGTLLPPTEGLLSGTIRWQQGNTGIALGGGFLGTRASVHFRDITTDQVYTYALEGPHFV